MRTAIGRTLLYGSAVAVMGKALYFCVFERTVPAQRLYGGQFQMLTIIGLTLSLLCHSIGLINTVMKSPMLEFVKNELNYVAIPLEVLIAVLYWSICAYDRGLVIPPEMMILMPQWLDLSVHLFPAVIGLAELFTYAKPWKKSFADEFSQFGLFAVGYYFWIRKCRFHNGTFPYPILELFEPTHLVLFFAFLVFVVSIFYLLLASVQTVLQGSPRGPAKAEGRNEKAKAN